MRDKLEQLLEQAKTLTPTEADREAQRNSFVYGNTRCAYPNLTREKFAEIIEDIKKMPAVDFNQSRRNNDNRTEIPEYDGLLDSLSIQQILIEQKT